MYRKISAFAVMALTLTACSAPAPETPPEVSPAPTAVVDTPAADADMAAINRKTYSSRTELVESLAKFDDTPCAWGVDRYEPGSTSAVTCMSLEFIIPMNAKTMSLTLETATKDGIPAGYEQTIEDTFAGLEALETLEDETTSVSDYMMASSKAKPALQAWDLID